MDFDLLKNKWQSVSLSSEHLDATNRRMAHELCVRRASSIQHKLARSYRRFSAFGFVLPLLAPLLLLLKLPVWLIVVYGAFGILMGAIYCSFARYIDRDDYFMLPIVDAVEHVIKIRMRQRDILIFGTVFGIAIIIPLFISFYHFDPSTLWGGIAGGIIGGWIGLKKELKFFRMSRRLLAELKAFRDTPATPDL